MGLAFGLRFWVQVQCFRPGMGNLTTITGRMNCALSLAGHKIN